MIERPDNPAHQAVLDGIRTLIQLCGRDPDSPALGDTPRRFLHAMLAKTDGVHTTDAAFLDSITTVFEAGHYDEMIVVKDIHFSSMCEHHLFPFEGKAHVGYLPSPLGGPGRNVIGLSKLPRIVRFAASRLSMQETICSHIATLIEQAVDCVGVGVVTEATHTCMTCRGIEAVGTTAVMQHLRGAFRADPSVKAEFLNVVQRP